MQEGPNPRQSQQQPWPQYGYGQPAQYRPPQQMHTKQNLSGGEHIVHAILTFMTAGLWGIVWIIRAARGRRTVTTYPR